MKAASATRSSEDSLSLRPIEGSDEDFLIRTYATTRADELAALPWTVSQKEAFIRMQFEAQRRYFASVNREADFSIITLSGAAIGRLYVDRGDEAFGIIDITLLPEYRNRGIGTCLIERVLREADAVGKPVRIRVLSLNPAARLYQRLGFRRVSDDGMFRRMVYGPRTS